MINHKTDKIIGGRGLYGALFLNCHLSSVICHNRMLSGNNMALCGNNMALLGNNALGSWGGSVIIFWILLEYSHT